MSSVPGRSKLGRTRCGFDHDFESIGLPSQRRMEQRRPTAVRAGEPVEERRVVALRRRLLGVASLFGLGHAADAQTNAPDAGGNRGGASENSGEVDLAFDPLLDALPPGFVSAADYFPKGFDTEKSDCCAYLALALKENERLYLPPGVYLLEGNRSTSDGLEIRSSQALVGGGPGRTIIRQGPGCRLAVSVNHGISGTPSLDENKRDIVIAGIRFEGFFNPLWREDVDQWYHSLTVHSATNVLVVNCHFVRFRGDGIYIGSGNGGGRAHVLVERHNRNIAIRDCMFDGRAGANRNAISVIDCDGLSIRDCVFRNCSSPPMPGAIDIEPNAPFNVINEIEIQGCIFEGRTGNFAIGLVLSAAREGTFGNLVSVRGNHFSRSLRPLRGCIGVVDWGPREVSRGSVALSVESNRFESDANPVHFMKLQGVIIRGNTFLGASPLALGAVGKSGGSVYDTIVSENRFLESGNEQAQLVVSGGARVRIARNSFLNPRVARQAILLIGEGNGVPMTEFVVEGNEFEAGSAQKYAIGFEGRWGPRQDVRIFGNRFDELRISEVAGRQQ